MRANITTRRLIEIMHDIISERMHVYVNKIANIGPNKYENLQAKQWKRGNRIS